MNIEREVGRCFGEPDGEYNGTFNWNTVTATLTFDCYLNEVSFMHIQRLSELLGTTDIHISHSDDGIQFACLNVTADMLG